MFRFPQCGSSRRLVRVKPEVRNQLQRRLITAQSEQSRGEVDHVAGRSAAEAVEIILIQFQARMPVIVERAGVQENKKTPGGIAKMVTVQPMAELLRNLPIKSRLRRGADSLLATTVIVAQTIRAFSVSTCLLRRNYRDIPTSSS